MAIQNLLVNAKNGTQVKFSNSGEAEGHTTCGVSGIEQSLIRGSDPVHPPSPPVEEWNGSAEGERWRRGRSPSWPDSPQCTTFDLKDPGIQLNYFHAFPLRFQCQFSDRKIMYLRRKPWRHLFWRICHSYPGSWKGWMYLGFPIHFHLYEQTPVEK